MDSEVDTIIRRRGYVTAAWILCWSTVLLVGLAYALFLQLGGDALCEPTPGSSNYGTFSWSIFPPGPKCTFTTEVSGFDEVRGPGPVMSIWLAVLLVGGGLGVRLLRSPFDRDGRLRGQSR